MATAPQPHYTPEEYLALERTAGYKSEYINGEIYPMVGGTHQHTALVYNIGGQLHTQLQGRSCDAYIGEMRVRVSATGMYTYPDVVVVCGEEQMADEHNDTVLNPTVIFEVLSPSTALYDRGDKFAHYQSLESLTDYVLVAQDRVRVEHFARQGDAWLLTVANNLSDGLYLAAIDCTLPLAKAYLYVDFPDPPARALRIRGPHHRYTPEEYLEIERAAEYKNEYRAGRIFPWPRVSLQHITITMNIGMILHTQFEGRPRDAGEVLVSMMRIHVPEAGLYTYPDVIAIDERSQLEDEYHDTLLNPTVLFEVLSPATEAYDQGEKFLSYQRLDSLTDYVLVDQNRVLVEHYGLRNGKWTLITETRDLGASIYLPAIDCTLPLAEIYKKVQFPDPPPAPPGHGRTAG